MTQKTSTDEQVKTFRSAATKHILPHFANNASLAREARIYTRGEGCYIYDIEGRRYLDTFASLLTTICGHTHPEIVRAIEEQLHRLEFFPNYEDSFTLPQIQLAQKLAEITPGDLAVTFFVNSGSEGNETAIKMARQYHRSCGQPQRYKVIARKYSYHGTTLGCVSATGLSWFRHQFEPLLPGFLFAPAARAHDRELASLNALRELVEFEGPDSIAAIIMDPIPGSNTGFPLPPEGYLEGVRALCDEYGILLIFDEVQTGFGKTGKWFACEHWGVTPDILVVGKGLAGGYVPVGAAITTPRIAGRFQKAPGDEFRSGSTFGGHTLGCAAALKCIEIIESDNLLERASSLGKYLRKQLDELYEFPIVGDVRGIGLLWAIELMADREQKTKFDPSLGLG